MTATNHALTGALTGLLIGQPLIALPLAVASHFICDALPHFGNSKDDPAQKCWFMVFLSLDGLLCLLLLGLLMFKQPLHWTTAWWCALAAAAPDVMWIPRFRRSRSGSADMAPHSALLKLHRWVQWFEHPSGAIVEITWMVSAWYMTGLFLR